MRKTVLILSSALVAGTIFFACKKANEVLTPSNSLAQTSNIDDVTSRVREFVKKADVTSKRMISNSNEVSNAVNYTIEDAVFIVEAASNYLHDDSIVGEERQVDTLLIPISVSTENGQEFVTEQNTIAAFNSINSFVAGIAANRDIMVVDVEPIKVNGLTTQLITTVLSVTASTERLIGSGVNEVMGDCDPFGSAESYLLTWNYNDLTTGHKQLEKKLDANCSAYQPCLSGQSIYYINVQNLSVSGLQNQSVMWAFQYANCINTTLFNGGNMGSIGGTSLNTYRTNAYNWANSNMPANTDTKLDHTVICGYYPCTINTGRSYWTMTVQYGKKVCYWPAD